MNNIRPQPDFESSASFSILHCSWLRFLGWYKLNIGGLPCQHEHFQFLALLPLCSLRWESDTVKPAPQGIGTHGCLATGCGFNWINPKPGQWNSCKEQWKISIVSSKLVACWGDDLSIHHIQFDVEVTVVNKILSWSEPWRWNPPEHKIWFVLQYSIFTIFKVQQQTTCRQQQPSVTTITEQIQNPFCHTHERWKARCNSTYKPVSNFLSLVSKFICIHGSEKTCINMKIYMSKRHEKP